ncbi:MAG: hypothetical protein QOE90_3489 [Thermoplasmata archaeon]|jgi:hypothetical protein|nr:hypothetical protein [Thermoplasmata archaeon]
MNKTILIATAILVSGLAGWLPTSQAVTLDQAWMTPGFTLSFTATPGATTTVDPSAPTVSGSFPVTFIVASVTSSSVTFDELQVSTGGKLVQQITYDRASRMGPDGGSILWINPSDIAAGSANFDGRTATLLVNTPAVVEFSDGQADYYFNAVTGLLERGENLFTGSSLSATGVALGIVPAADNTAVTTIRVALPIALPLAATPVTPPGGVSAQSAGDVQRSCSGQVTTSVFGGTDSCSMSWFTAYGDFQVQAYVDYPLLGQGTISGHIDDSISWALGSYVSWTCTAGSPALSSSDIACTASGSRSFIPGPQFPKGNAQFSYCLNPVTLFSCPWDTGFEATGSVF